MAARKSKVSNVGRGLDPSLLFCGYYKTPRRGGVTPPYIALYKNVSA